MQEQEIMRHVLGKHNPKAITRINFSKRKKLQITGNAIPTKLRLFELRDPALPRPLLQRGRHLADSTLPLEPREHIEILARLGEDVAVRQSREIHAVALLREMLDQHICFGDRERRRVCEFT